MKGTGVDRAVASTSEKKFGGSGVEVITVEGSNGFDQTIGDEVLEHWGIPILIVVDEPTHPWMESRQGFW